MTLRSRVFLGGLAVAVVPLAILGWALTRQSTARLETQYLVRVGDRIQIVSERLGLARDELAARLDAVEGQVESDDRLRVALRQDDPPSREYVRDWAERALALSGLTVLQLQDSDGTVLSSGHFRGDFGRSDPKLTEQLRRSPTGALVEFAAPSGPLLALSAARPVRVGRTMVLWLVGGVDAVPILPGAQGHDPLTVTLLLPETERVAAGASDAGQVVLDLPIPAIRVEGRSTRLDTAVVRVRHATTELDALRRQTALTLAVGVLAAGLLATVLAGWLSARVSAPLEAVARKTARVDLDRLDVSFDTHTRDEVGRLSRFLDDMTTRLRESAIELREAERRATLGEVARQVNHDVKNAITPLRNALRHLDQVDRESPEALGSVFRDRKGTLQAGVEYLGKLAARYARLAPSVSRAGFDAAEVLADLARAREFPGRLEVRRPSQVLSMIGDPLALRRVLDNLVSNALDSMDGGPGMVIVSADMLPEDEGYALQIEVRDTGIGMDADELERAMEDFSTTKASGTGLGFSIVRRLVADMGGTLTVESAPGRGTSVRLRFPTRAEGMGG